MQEMVDLHWIRALPLPRLGPGGFSGSRSHRRPPSLVRRFRNTCLIHEIHDLPLDRPPFNDRRTHPHVHLRPWSRFELFGNDLRGLGHPVRPFPLRIFNLIFPCLILFFGSFFSLSLEEWVASLPAALKVSPQVSTPPPSHILLLNMLYHFLVVFLHRPWYLRAASLATPLGNAAQRRCASAASRILSLARVRLKFHVEIPTSQG